MSPETARKPQKTTMPDVAREGSVPLSGALDRVGMAGIEVPVRLRDEGGAAVLVPARADAYVSLDDPEARGIHMSRLFLSLQAILAEKELSANVIKRLLQAFVGSHAATSSSSFVRISFDLPVKRPALKSNNSAWRHYPVTISGELIDGRVRIRLGATIMYSSTCPCSAALARQLIQERFRGDFAGRTMVDAAEVAAWLGLEDSICATPHSQRSHAAIEVQVDERAEAPTLVELIDAAEGALKTAVQAAVKREDEQEFARLNAANLMFCEDAARRLKIVFESDRRIADYRIEAVHVESLHPHDAVSVAVKGIPGGFRP